MKYVFNHHYILRHDEQRSILFAHDYNDSIVNVSKEWGSYIHPIYAMMLSMFSIPTTLENAITKISRFFDFSNEYVTELITKFIENEEEFHTKYAGSSNSFPKNLIIREENLRDRIRLYEPEMFIYSKIDLKTFRLYSAPLNVTFMVTNKCLTNCIYCYADRNVKCKNLDFAEVEKIIDDAYNLKIHTFNVDGGDFFLYPHWRKLLEKLKNCEYRPEIISTKYPISEIDIKDFAKYNISLQVSLDSINQEVLNKIVGKISDYAEKMKRTLNTLDTYIPFQIATILTKYNSSIAELEKMYDLFKGYKNIRRWEIRVGFKSLYSKKNFEEIKIEEKEIKAIEKWISTKQKVSKFEIQWSPGREVNFFKAKNGSKDFAGSRCSADTLHIFILPDGKVTICEQLYWKKNFIIGDLKQNSISEIWNSDRALFFANITQKDYSQDSACKNCSIFKECRSNMNNCYANILKVYGDEHWDYPDPRCAKAPRDISEKIYV